jgi:hypothetical protein
VLRINHTHRCCAPYGGDPSLLHQLTARSA